MEMKKLVNGPSHKYRGSIFVLAIATLGIFTFLYLALAEHYQLTVYATNRNTQYYQMAIMKELFLVEYLDIPENERPMSGSYQYSVGTVDFYREELKLVIITKTKKHKQRYEEIIETSESTQSSELDFSENTSGTTEESIQFSSESSTVESLID